MFYDRLIAPFIHRSHRNTVTDVVCAAVPAVNATPLHRCFSGLALCSNVFVVSC